ncbi:defective chorion-1 protein, FC106 isoform isoform X2 [Drosophila ficusphila]|uniref:defective chorion-1 protein, FC106 isoform isoform X2 n=1 Tax=Drosophila ficusphila TaxID=30025 RepID=UPI0007E832E5|nr:defective chorion-1 protein, FC106 isoform isoform X2 [Drosophila ficusphila]
MRVHCLLLLLALLGAQAECPSDGSTDVAAENPSADDGVTSNATAPTRPRIPTPDEILGQVPPISPIRTGNPQMDAFYLMFPALASLLRWGSLFPAHSILSAVPDNLQPTAAASKVVLVLADDPATKTRVTRQNPVTNPLGQMMNWPAVPQDILSQANFPPLPPMDFGPQVGQFLAQLPPMASGGFLGAAAPVPTPVADPPPAPAAPAPAPPAPAPPAPAAAPDSPLPALGQGIQPLLGQAMALLNPTNIDPAGLLGQAVPNLSNLPAPNLDFVAQMQRQFFPATVPAASAGADAQASDISEVRVRPEIPYSPEAQYAQLKIKSALERQQDRQEKQEDQERVPLLWFRLPTTTTTSTTDELEDKTLEDLRVEAKLRAFERQVIAELKMLQKIELMAKEMRSSAAQTSPDSPYRINYSLSRTPVHKITRSDIEHALRDDYVRRLVAKEAQRKARTSAHISRKAGGFKRQAKAEDPTLTKEEIVKIMAYAYRMASEQMENEKGKQDKVYAAYRTAESPNQQQPMENSQMIQQQQQRQWAEDQVRMQKERQMAQQMAQQNPMMMQQRQWTEDPSKVQQTQQRQWSEDPAKAQQMQQRQWSEDPAKVQQMQQRQWSEEQARIQQNQQQQRQMENPQMIQQSPMMMQQRQWSEDPAQVQQMQQMQQRQWSEEQAKIQQTQQQMQQNPMMMQQRQWTEDSAKVHQMQQRQWAEDQARMQQQPQPQMIQQNQMMMQQRQMKSPQMMMQQQQQQPRMQQSPMMMQQLQQQQMQQQPRQWANQEDEAAQRWAMEKSQAMQQDPNQMAAQMQRQPDGDDDDSKSDDESKETILGEAGPQMAENEGKARHKGGDPLGLGGNRKKSKSKHSHSSRPAVINYYYQVPQRPAPVPSYPSSYGTSYGGGGYGSNAYGSPAPVRANPYPAAIPAPAPVYSSYPAQGYRAAVGNEEVDDMLRQHQTMARATHFRQ